jgi:hypothetical protein
MAIRSTHEATLVSAISSAGKVRTSHEATLISVTEPIVTITYPLNPPSITGIGPQNFTLRQVNVVGETESPFSLQQQIQQWSGQAWQIEADLPPMLYPQAEQWISFLGALFGKFGTFLMGDYNRPAPQGAFNGAPQTGSIAAGSQQITITGATAGIPRWAVAGDYIQITPAGAPTRLFKVLIDAASDGSGNVTLDVFPNTREVIPLATGIVFGNARGTFRLMENSTQWTIDKNKLYKISFKAQEAI